jgi:hypothetical protein
MATKGLGLGSAKVEVLLTANTNYKEQYKKLTSVKPKIKNYSSKCTVISLLFAI